MVRYSLEVALRRMTVMFNSPIYPHTVYMLATMIFSFAKLSSIFGPPIFGNFSAEQQYRLHDRSCKTLQWHGQTAGFYVNDVLRITVNTKHG